MEIGFTGDAIVILKESIDDEEPLRLDVKVERVMEEGILAIYEDNDEEQHTYFIPFTNIRAIEKWTPDDSPEEQPQQQGGF